MGKHLLRDMNTEPATLQYVAHQQCEDKRDKQEGRRMTEDKEEEDVG